MGDSEILPTIRNRRWSHQDRKQLLGSAQNFTTIFYGIRQFYTGLTVFERGVIDTEGEHDPPVSLWAGDKQPPPANALLCSRCSRRTQGCSSDIMTLPSSRSANSSHPTDLRIANAVDEGVAYEANTRIS